MQVDNNQAAQYFITFDAVSLPGSHDNVNCNAAFYTKAINKNGKVNITAINGKSSCSNPRYHFAIPYGEENKSITISMYEL